MLRTTPLLIVMMLLGNAGVSLACEIWCINPAAQGHHEANGCHDGSIPVAADQLLVSTEGCHSPELTAFISEVRQPDLRLMAVTARAIGSGSLVPDRAGLTEGWCVFNVQPSRPQASRTILRI